MWRSSTLLSGITRELQVEDFLLRVSGYCRPSLALGSSSTGVATRDTTAEVHTSFSEDLAGPYLLVWDLSSSRMGTVELRFTEVITLEVNLAKTLL